jgi:hypothetical protein
MGVQGDGQMKTTGLVYVIKVQNKLSENWLSWFNDMTVTLEQADDCMPVTVLTARVVDQARLRGILNKLWDLNLTLISVRRVEADGGEKQDETK